MLFRLQAVYCMILRLLVVRWCLCGLCGLFNQRRTAGKRKVLYLVYVRQATKALAV